MSSSIASEYEACAGNQDDDAAPWIIAAGEGCASDDDARRRSLEALSTESLPGDGRLPGAEALLQFPPSEFENFRIVRALGRGGMGEVYLAEDTSIGRLVAIKFIRHPSALARELFRNEARAVGKLDHTNIVRIFHAGEVADTPYIVTEFVPGRSLGEILRERSEPLRWRQALAWGIEIAAGLSAAHRCGVLHRDIKPTNVIITEQGHAKLLDFGLAEVTETIAELNAGESDVGENGDPVTAGRRPGWIAGTRYYMAPECWRGANSPASDVYALGVVLFEMCTGHVPFYEVDGYALGAVTAEHDAPALADLVPGIDAGFAAVVDRCLAREEAARYADGGALLAALQALQERDLDAVEPYPGLRAFDAADSACYFGRTQESRELIARMSECSMVLIVGKSGVGKSSLMRAGVLSRLRAAEAEGEDAGAWAVASWVPGRQPLQAMAAALLPFAKRDGQRDEAEIVAALRRDPCAVDAWLDLDGARRLVLALDQLEELVTMSDEDAADEARAASRALARLAQGCARIQVLATVRADLFIDVVALPGLERLSARALFLLQPLSETQTREAIVRPAERHGVRFESQDMVDALVQSSIDEVGGLPLLQFALALLWEGRDRERGRITAEALARIGGVAGALARHADRVLAEIPPVARSDARAILLRLVSLRRSRVRCHLCDFGAERPQRAHALEALVRGRLVVAHELDGDHTYEIAHEALTHGWPTLSGWLAEVDHRLHLKRQLAIDAADWHERARLDELLWGRRRLRSARALEGEELAPLEAAFLSESRRALRRSLLLWLSLGSAAVVAMVALLGAMHYREQRETLALLEDGRRSLHYGVAPLMRAYLQERESALHAFSELDIDRMNEETLEAKRAAAEKVWSRALALGETLDEQMNLTAARLQRALMSPAVSAAGREAWIHLLYLRAVLAEKREQHRALRELLAELEEYGASWVMRWRDTAPVQVTSDAHEQLFRVYRFDVGEDGKRHRERVEESFKAPVRLDLPPGAYLVEMSAHLEGPAKAASGTDAREGMGAVAGMVDDAAPSIVYPLWVPPGGGDGTLHVHLDSRALDLVPPGYVCIAGGTMWFGDGSDVYSERIREWEFALPLHRRAIDGFCIGRREVSYAAWIAFLRDLPPERRVRFLPDAEFSGTSIALDEEEGSFVFVYRYSDDGTEELRAREGELLVYPERRHLREQDWTRMPVTGISGEAVAEFARWLARRRSLIGGRLCAEDEWEWAARAPDTRVYPHGDGLAPGEANFDRSYGNRWGATGLDEVGSHTGSRSPSGLDDLVGNAREMTRSILQPALITLRSGSFFRTRRTNRLVNREPMLLAQANPFSGFRLCTDADWLTSVHHDVEAEAR